MHDEDNGQQLRDEQRISLHKFRAEKGMHDPVAYQPECCKKADPDKAENKLYALDHLAKDLEVFLRPHACHVWIDNSLHH